MIGDLKAMIAVTAISNGHPDAAQFWEEAIVEMAEERCKMPVEQRPEHDDAVRLLVEYRGTKRPSVPTLAPAQLPSP